MSDHNPITTILLTALTQPANLKPMVQAAGREILGLAFEAAGQGMRGKTSANKEEADADDKSTNLP